MKTKKNNLNPQTKGYLKISLNQCSPLFQCYALLTADCLVWIGGQPGQVTEAGIGESDYLYSTAISRRAWNSLVINIGEENLSIKVQLLYNLYYIIIISQGEEDIWLFVTPVPNSDWFIELSVHPTF